MSEEESRPPLREIPARPLRDTNADEERKVISLVNALKENFEVREEGLRQDLEEKIIEVARTQQAGYDEIRQENDTFRNEISSNLAELDDKIDNLNTPMSEIEAFKGEIEENMAQIQSVVSKFDLTLFINEIRDAFSTKLQIAEEKIKELTAQVEGSRDSDETMTVLSARLEDSQQEVERLQQEVQNLQQELAAKGEELRQLQASKTSIPKAPPATKYGPPAKPVTAQPTLKEIAPKGEDSEGSTEKPVKFCKSCGKPRTRNTARFCIYCGAEY